MKSKTDSSRGRKGFSGTSYLCSGYTVTEWERKKKIGDSKNIFREKGAVNLRKKDFRTRERSEASYGVELWVGLGSNLALGEGARKDKEQKVEGKKLTSFKSESHKTGLIMRRERVGRKDFKERKRNPEAEEGQLLSLKSLEPIKGERKRRGNEATRQ